MEFVDLKAQYRLLEGAINQRISTVIEHGRFIMGPEVAELETALADFVGVQHCIGVASGTDALQVAMMALGIGPGDEVITTPFTFIASGETIALLGAKPVFIDILPDTYNLDPRLIEAAVTAQTKAIMPVSLYGQCAAMDEINAAADALGLVVIEDGAQSLGATYKGRSSCGLSTVGCTSFFPSKPLGAYGDAGACFTNDAELAKRMSEIRVHGQDRRYHHPLIGTNSRLDTLQAAILLAKFEAFEQEVSSRGLVGDRYSEMLAAQGGQVVTPFIESHNTSVYAQYTVQVDNRVEVQSGLAERGIPTAVHYPVPLHLQPAFGFLDSAEQGRFPVAEAAAEKVISLPMHPYLSVPEQQEVVTALVELAVSELAVR
jgi:UDP-2-acetamido-2-deoxy-ribo-hexuluronate aminotransferase